MFNLWHPHNTNNHIHTPSLIHNIHKDMIISKNLLYFGLGVFAFAKGAHSQVAADCPLWGPAYPKPSNPAKTSTVKHAISAVREGLAGIIKNPTFHAANTSFHLSIFSAEDTLLDYSYAAPGQEDSLQSGVLNKDTIFRIGSVSKLLSVYTLLAATGNKYMNDPITKWVPELADAYEPEEGDLTHVRWCDITIGALGSHMAGLQKDGMFDSSAVMKSILNL